MTEKEKQFNQWFDWYADGVKVFEEADMKQAYLQGQLDLVKENAELKEQCSILADCNTCTSACKTENIEMKNNLQSKRHY